MVCSTVGVPICIVVASWPGCIFATIVTTAAQHKQRPKIWVCLNSAQEEEANEK